jgi:hypothetical protein
MSTLPESTGLFPRSQPEWAAHRIATFPVTVTAAGVKKPAVKHYGKLGLRASAQLAQKRSFANIDGVGFMAGPHSKITVIDIDDPDERLLTEVLDRHGSTPFIVRTASGKHHAYYRHSNERRRIRPWRDLPLDLLGSGGFVIAPPTLISGKGAYEIIAGNLDDLRRLPPIHNLDLEPATEISSGPELIIPEKLPQVGQRNNGLWRHCMRHAQRCDQFDDLLDEARTFNMALDTPLSDSEVTNTAASAWGYTMHGLNRFGQHGVWSSSEEIAAMMQPGRLPAADVLARLQRAARAVHVRQRAGREVRMDETPARGRAVPANRAQLHHPRASGWTRQPGAVQVDQMTTEIPFRERVSGIVHLSLIYTPSSSSPPCGPEFGQHQSPG